VLTPLTSLGQALSKKGDIVRIQSKVADLEQLVYLGRSDNICAVLP
jgi:hypothetical protein